MALFLRIGFGRRCEYACLPFDILFNFLRKDSAKAAWNHLRNPRVTGFSTFPGKDQTRSIEHSPSTLERIQQCGKRVYSIAELIR